MSKKVLFEITEDHLETGLRGFPVGYCVTSTVDPKKGLFYSGKRVSELASWRTEKVIYLLISGKEGDEKEVSEFFANLEKRATLHTKTVEAIEKLPREGSPMKLFASAMLIMGMLEGKNNYQEDYLDLVAKAPILVATLINYHAGWGKTPPPQPQVGYIENFVMMLRIPNGDSKKLIEAFHLFNILHYDHGGGNLSTFVGKAVASGLEDMYGSMAAALCALAGSRHGKANEECLRFIREISNEVGENETAEKIHQFLQRRLSKQNKIPGFGHAVLRVEDPRASVIYDYLSSHYPNHPLVKIALLLRHEGSTILAQYPKISDPHPNIDAVSGSLLVAAGFDYPEYFTILFGLSRIVGIGRQIIYERLEARQGKGTPIVRPKYLYSGPKI